MLVIGLTGSIGMGKSTVAAHLKARGVAVLDADAEVHRLYAGEAVPLIEAAFPGSTRKGKVDRTKLASLLMAEPGSFGRLEAIVHPLVQSAEREFLRNCAAAGHTIAVLEIPLLYETGGDRKVDAVIVVSAPAAVQRERVLARPGMTEEKLRQILARQMSDSEKRARAEFVVDTSASVEESHAQLDKILESLGGRVGRALERWL